MATLTLRIIVPSPPSQSPGFLPLFIRKLLGLWVEVIDIGPVTPVIWEAICRAMVESSVYSPLFTPGSMFRGDSVTWPRLFP